MRNYSAQPHRAEKSIYMGCPTGVAKKSGRNSPKHADAAGICKQSNSDRLGDLNRTQKRNYHLYIKANSAENPQGNRLSDKINDGDFNSLIWQPKGGSTNTAAPAARAASMRRLSMIVGNADFVWNHHQKHPSCWPRCFCNLWHAPKSLFPRIKNCQPSIKVLRRHTIQMRFVCGI